jgi:hypothetical protein
MDLKETGLEILEKIHLAQNMDQQVTLVNLVTNLGITCETGEFLD